MTDRALWGELQAGNHKALEQIYRAHFSFLFNYGKKICGEIQIVEDCIQELFVEIWDKRARLSPTDKIRPYLMLSLKRKIFRANKKYKKESSIPTTNNESIFGTDQAVESLLVSKEIEASKRKKLQQSIDQLSARQKEILYLKYYSGLDYEEISQCLDMNYQSARNLMSRTLRKLSELMLGVIFTIFSLLYEYKMMLDTFI